VSHKLPSVDEFVTDGDRVIHSPTGAWFSAYKGKAEISHRGLGRAGAVLPNGDDYWADEIQEIAAKLLRARIRPGWVQYAR
jgi:hypothetical protein